MGELKTRQKIALVLAVLSGIVLVNLAASKAAIIKVDKAYSAHFQSTWNKFEPGYRLLAIACWNSTNKLYKNCLIDRAAVGKGRPVCGLIGVDTKFPITKDGVVNAVEGFTPYTCSSVIPDIKQYLSQGAFVA